jgi:hypothetical protein
MRLHYGLLYTGDIVFLKVAYTLEEKGAPPVIKEFTGQLFTLFTQTGENLLHKALPVRSEIGQNDLAFSCAIHPVTSFLPMRTVILFYPLDAYLNTRPKPGLTGKIVDTI